MELNRQQESAVQYDGGHALVLAGAGSGKTSTIGARAAKLIKRGVEPKHILLLTFTRRAAREMIFRMKTVVGPAADRVAAGTFHHFCLTTMRRMSKKFGIENASVIDQDDAVQLMKLARATVVEKDKIFPKAARLSSIHSYSRNTNRPVREYLQKHTEYEDEDIEKILAVFKDYSLRKRLNNYLDFDDILHVFAKRLHEDAGIRQRLRGLFSHILVDELQDTNPLQWLILDGLRDPAELFCVGDDAQSIYAFRGADFKNVHSFKKRVPDSKVFKLEKNYRSTQEILDLANWLLEESPLSYNKKLRAARGKGLKPRLMDFESENDEGNWIASEIINRHEDGAKWADHMILTRTAWASRTLEASLIERKIPYRFIGGTSLIQAAHVKDLFSMLRASVSHKDSLAWVRYLTLWPRIGDKSAQRIIDGMKPMQTIEDAFKWVQKQFTDRKDIIQGIIKTREYLNKPSEAIRKGTQLLEPLLEKRYERWDRRKKDLKLLERLAKRHKSIQAFIEAYTLDPISSTQAVRSENQDSVTLITVHSAKGAEAPTCYIIRAEPGMYPHIRSLGDKDQEEEERRILYVAMTRAMDELIVTRSCQHHGARVFHDSHSAEQSHGGSGYFLQDVPEGLVECGGASFRDGCERDAEDEYVIRVRSRNK